MLTALPKHYLIEDQNWNDKAVVIVIMKMLLIQELSFLKPLEELELQPNYYSHSAFVRPRKMKG